MDPMGLPPPKISDGLVRKRNSPSLVCGFFFLKSNGLDVGVSVVSKLVRDPFNLGFASGDFWLVPTMRFMAIWGGTYF